MFCAAWMEVGEGLNHDFPLLCRPWACIRSFPKLLFKAGMKL